MVRGLETLQNNQSEWGQADGEPKKLVFKLEDMPSSDSERLTDDKSQAKLKIH
jgi:hypothetical protein